MNQHNKVLARLTKLLDLSVSTMPGVPIVEMAGNRRVLVENHHGVAEYEKTRIIILVKFGKIIIAGMNLEICHMSRHQMIIIGCIDSVSIERECC